MAAWKWEISSSGQVMFYLLYETTKPFHFFCCERRDLLLCNLWQWWSFHVWRYYKRVIFSPHVWRYHGARSIQPESQPVRRRKVVHLKRWTRFFETFPVGPNRSIEFWTEISGHFGWMDRAPFFRAKAHLVFHWCHVTNKCFLSKRPVVRHVS